MGSRLEQRSSLVRKRIEGHVFGGEDGEEYEGSKFGGFSDYFRRKKVKLQNLDAGIRAQQTDKPQIFRGVVCHVNGYTQPSLNDLHTMIVQHGGGFIQYLDGKTMVTHIIASNLTHKKKEEFRRYRIVKPAWIVESIGAGKLLPWDKYRVVGEGVAQKVLGFEDGNIISQTSNRIQGYREQTDTSWYTLQLKSDGDSLQHPNRPSHAVLSPKDTGGDDVVTVPNITSSNGQALTEVDRLQLARTAIGPVNDSCRASSMASEGQACSPQSPPPRHPATTKTAFGVSETADEQPLLPSPIAQSRDDSQVPDFSHAVVRDSKILREISPSRLAKMTAEEHNSLLLSDPNIRKSTVVNPDFLDQYYRESRLHHLSTWKADLKAQMQALAAERSTSQQAKHKRLPRQRRYIMHVDFDSFFATVSLKKHPQYKDKPAVVAHGGGSGSEIASCNYPARKFGINNGMWMKRAQQLCPDLKILPYDFPAYEDASRIFYNTILATEGLVQSVSIDEALIDISAICFAESGSDGVVRHEGAVYREQCQADHVAQMLRANILAKTGCEVSVGIGGNILQAKVALRKAKPAGQYHLKPEDVLDFIGGLEVTKLPGVAWSIGGKLEEIGIKFVKDAREATKEKLTTVLGPKTGEKIWEYARGIDKTEIGEQVIRKSVSAEVNWGVRFENQEQVDDFMRGLCGELNKRLLRERVKGRQLTMKIMKRAADAPLDPPKHLGHGRCDVFNKSLQLGVATNDTALITKEAIYMMRSFAVSPGELRGIGMQMQKLEPLKQGLNGVDRASQRKLQFKVNAPPAKVSDVDMGAALSQQLDDAPKDVLRMPQEQQSSKTNEPSASFRSVLSNTPPERSLNTSGTQFLLPTQVDPEILAELPDDIQAKLRKHMTRPVIENLDITKPSGPTGASLAGMTPGIWIPRESQIDPSIFEALPTDVREEIIGFYQSHCYRSEKRENQSVLPQSPRKARSLPPTRQPAVKQARGRPRGSKNPVANRLRNYAAQENSTLTQANFVNRPVDGGEDDVESQVQDLDPDVFAALPEDVRQEVIAQQRQARLQQLGGIDLSLHQRKKVSGKSNVEEAGLLDRYFALAPRPPVPTFTCRKFSNLFDLRNAINAWFDEFSDEGPYKDDVASLIKYLRDVILEERDLYKALAVVKWMAWVIDEGEEKVEKKALCIWRESLVELQRGVQDAAVKRGVGTIDFL